MSNDGSPGGSDGDDGNGERRATQRATEHPASPFLAGTDDDPRHRMSAPIVSPPDGPESVSFGVVLWPFPADEDPGDRAKERLPDVGVN